MFKWPRFEVLDISRRDFALVFSLLFNVFTWSYMAIMVIEKIPVNLSLRSTFSMVFYIGASGASLSGALLSEKVDRWRFLYFWMILGVVSSFFLIFINSIAPSVLEASSRSMVTLSITVAGLSIVFILLGISFGLGMPSSFAHLADSSTVENRARISSLVLLASNLAALPLAMTFLTSDPVLNAIVLTAWRAVGLATFWLIGSKERVIRSYEQKRASFASVFYDKSLSLYLVPWVMFCLIDTLEKSLLIKNRDFISLGLQPIMLTVEPLVAVPLMFVSGFLADRIGRKKVVISGFVSLGIGYAAVGLASALKEAWYFYFVVDGVAWSIFYTILLLTVWGDLSQLGTREKYYAVANFPFVIRSTFPLFLIPPAYGLAPNAVSEALASVSSNAAFSLASFFLFMAVLPLMHAPETLPERRIELRRVKGYIEQAKKLKDKYFEKSSQKES